MLPHKNFRKLNYDALYNQKLTSQNIQIMQNLFKTAHFQTQNWSVGAFVILITKKSCNEGLIIIHNCVGVRLDKKHPDKDKLYWKPVKKISQVWLKSSVCNFASQERKSIM